MPDPRDALLEAGFADYIQALGALSEFRAEVARRSALAVARAWPGLKPWPSFEPASLNHGLTWGAWLGVRWEHGGMKVWAGLQWITDERWYAHAGVTPAAEGDRAEVAGWLRTLAPGAEVHDDCGEVGVRTPTTAEGFEADLEGLVRLVKLALHAQETPE